MPGWFDSVVHHRLLKANSPIICGHMNLEQKLEELKDRLLEKETVDADEVKRVLTGTHMPKTAALY